MRPSHTYGDMESLVLRQRERLGDYLSAHSCFQSQCFHWPPKVQHKTWVKGICFCLEPLNCMGHSQSVGQLQSAGSAQLQLICLSEHIFLVVFISTVHTQTHTVGFFLTQCSLTNWPIQGESNFYGAECFATTKDTIFEDTKQKYGGVKAEKQKGRKINTKGDQKKVLVKIITFIVFKSLNTCLNLSEINCCCFETEVIKS